MENEPIIYNHAKPVERLEWFVIILFSLLAWYFYSVVSPAFIFCLVYAGKSVYDLIRRYWLRSRVSHALILTDDYIQAPCALVSNYTYPIAWEDIKAITGTIEKKSKISSEYALILLKNRTKNLGEITKRDIKKAQKLSKKYFVSGVLNNDNFDFEDASDRNYDYFQNSILFDLSFIADTDGQLIAKLKEYSGGKVSGFNESDCPSSYKMAQTKPET